MSREKHLDKYSLFLIAACIVINIIGAQLALLFDLPVFLDSIGTILSAALGGYIPGMIVGFFTNVINGISDPITLYYGILSILIAAAGAFFAYRGGFLRIRRAIPAALCFAFIGGCIGSVLTWLLYGFNIGDGISAPFAAMLINNAGFDKFFAQFTADIAIDLADKLISTGIVLLLIRIIPQKAIAKLPLADIYKDRKPHAHRIDKAANKFFRKRSLRTEVVSIIVCSVIIIGTIATTIGYILYCNTTTDKYIGTARDITCLMAAETDADLIDGWLESGREDEEYLTTEHFYEQIMKNVTDIEYIYVYKILDDGCHVIFDIDTPDLPGEPLGSFVSFDASFDKYRNDLIHGKPIDPVISNDKYGWLLTVYEPLYDSAGKCAAYAAVDISMTDVIADRYVFIIRMAALMFGISIIIVAFALWFADRRLVGPINAISSAAREFAFDDDESRTKSTQLIRSLNIKTGDEIENLYIAITKTVSDVSTYITDIKEQASVIARMQNGIILSFANMVESRDVCTGEHIKHTASYVEIIARELKHDRQYADILSEEYIQNLIRSAPMHDIGKIKVSDSILNKPGKLTPEEFELMKSHTTAGRDILLGTAGSISDSHYLSTAMQMAQFHHERWDGKGYPEGRSGSDIPLCARIMAVADVYDALISKRSYKKPFPPEKALDIIRSSSGTQFDPAVVDAFVRAFDNIAHLGGGNPGS